MSRRSRCPSEFAVILTKISKQCNTMVSTERLVLLRQEATVGMFRAIPIPRSSAVMSFTGKSQVRGGVVTRVLVVDDDVHARTVARAVLEHAGIEVDEAVDGAAGLRAYRDAGYDLVLCDLFMPDVDGLELIRELRRDFPEIKIIAMSAGGYHGTVDLLAVARHLGASEVLPKPFSPWVLVQAVERVLRPPTDDN